MRFTGPERRCRRGPVRLTMILLVLLAAAPLGCTDPCAELAEECDACIPHERKAECEFVVSSDNDDDCDAILERGACR